MLDILAFQILLDRSLSELEYVFQLECGEAAVCLADLTAVITCDYQQPQGDGKMTFLHASLPDFLLDKSRSRPYHIDLYEYGIKLLCMSLERPPPILGLLSLTGDEVSNQETLQLGTIEELIQKTQPWMSDRLHRAFMNFNFMPYPRQMYNPGFMVDQYCISILKYLYQQVCNLHKAYTSSG